MPSRSNPSTSVNPQKPANAPYLSTRTRAEALGSNRSMASRICVGPSR